jgi:hypothetical protein
MTVESFAHKTNQSEQDIIKRIKDGVLEGRMFDGIWRVRVDDIEFEEGIELPESNNDTLSRTEEKIKNSSITPSLILGRILLSVGLFGMLVSLVLFGIISSYNYETVFQVIQVQLELLVVTVSSILLTGFGITTILLNNIVNLLKIQKR